MTIEAAVFNYWQSGSPNLHHYRSFEGYCENIPRGKVYFELWVGRCPSEPLGKTYIGWSSVSRITVEEVSRTQTWSLQLPPRKVIFQYCTVHHALRIDISSQLSNRMHSDNSIGFRSMHEVNSYYDLLLSKKYVDLFLLLDNFGVKIISFRLET